MKTYGKTLEGLLKKKTIKLSQYVNGIEDTLFSSGTSIEEDEVILQPFNG